MRRDNEENNIEICIENWEKYNPRNDQKSYSWFRLSNNFALDTKIFSLKNVHKLSFIFLLCEFSKQNSSKIELDFTYFCHIYNIRMKIAKESVKMLEKKGIISITYKKKEHVSVRIDHATNERTNDTNDIARTCDYITNSDELAQSSKMTPQFLFNLWNKSTISDIPKALSFSPSRKKNAIARIKENACADYWNSVISKINESKFCRGENDRGWKANFDWLLKPNTATALLEGKYDDRPSGGKKKQELSLAAREYYEEEKAKKLELEKKNENLPGNKAGGNENNQGATS